MSTSREPQLRVQINQIDYTLGSPGELDKTKFPLAPVIRIYGTSSLGETACVHVHQVYPYFYVEYAGSLDPDHVKRYTTTLASSLNHAIALSLKRNPHSPRSQYVRAILLVKGIHFYGFHSRYSPFLKIYFVDPATVSRAAAILQSGTVMATCFRVYECHLSYILQFMCDFNLYGCGWIDLSQVYLRGPEQLSDEDDGESPACSVFKPSPYYCQSRLRLEFDVIAPHILNKWHLKMRDIHHTLQIPEPKISTEPLVSSVRELWEDERRRRTARGLEPSPEMPVDPSESSRGPGGGWVAEQRWYEALLLRIQREQELGSYVESHGQGWEKWTMPAFDSVEALWDREYRTWTAGRFQPGRDAESVRLMSVPETGDRDVDVQVNTGMLSSQEMTQMLRAAEEECRNDVNEDGGQDLPGDELCDANEEPFEQEKQVSRAESPENPFVGGGTSIADFSLPSVSSVDFGGENEPTSEERSPHGKTILPFMTPTRPQGLSARTRTPSTPTRARSATPSHWNYNKFSSPEASPRPVKRRKIDAERPLSSVALTSIRPPSFVQLSMHQSFEAMKTSNQNRFAYGPPPPTTSDLQESLVLHNLPQQIYREPYYSDVADIPRKVLTYGGLQFRLKGGQGVAYLEEWSMDGRHEETTLCSTHLQFHGSEHRGWEYASSPPSVRQTKKWLRNNKKCPLLAERRETSQIEGPTLKNIFGLGTSPGLQGENVRETQDMSVLSIEIFAPSDNGLMPDHRKDEIAAVFYAFQRHEGDPLQTGILALKSENLNKSRIRSIPMEEALSELDLLNMLIDVINDLDPDILTGWEVQRSSWGYCSARAAHYGYELTELISRAPPGRGINDYDQWGLQHTSTIRVAGRHVLNGWRIMRSEQNLHSYTLENVVFRVLRKRVPHFSQSTLTTWYHSPIPAHSVALLRYFSSRTCMALDILNTTEIVSKTAEFARIFGVDFFSVISRGSQFKVESFMFRIAKPENYILLSPSKSDVGKQNAAECMPLIMEPKSAFYSSPLLVLDFQSLYPSVMIAYNYCYSTCLGRVTDFRGRNKFGVVDLEQPAGILGLLKEYIHIAPNGVIYVKPEVRKGLLRRMLVELLETRVMIKQAMKSARDNKSLLRVLDARQLSLKYISNVTYGYTSATYSGRMPAVEIADSIVQSGRETLEKGSLAQGPAITVINSTKKWGAQVVYGDTDSVFVHLPGKTKEQAFRIGNDIADTITSLNPSPIKLKFEKVYHPCVLLAKKRYVGFKYESLDQREPVFDAKGIETVRRDGVFAQQKMTENCLKILFRSQDLSKIKAYCYRSWAKLMDDRASIQDFIFHKEVKLGTYSDKGLPPPGAMVAARRMLLDSNNEPQYGERVPYVIARGPPGSRLVDKAMDPLEFMQNRQLRLDATYYITRVLIPPLERILNLVGVDVRQWFNEMPKPSQLNPMMSPKKSKATKADSPSKVAINDHFLSTQCLACSAPASGEDLCNNCRSAPQETAAKFGYDLRAATKRLADSHLICASCANFAPCEPVECDSLDCSWFFARNKAEKRAESLAAIEEAYRHAKTRSQSPVLYVIDEESD